MKYWMLAVPLATVMGCANHHCRRAPDAPVGVAEKPATSSDINSSRRVKVYKYDGSLQCNQGKVISLEAMTKDLRDITVYSSVKKPDGLMHIQVCGSNTGMANVFEIAESDLAKAESFGFKKWTFE